MLLTMRSNFPYRRDCLRIDRVIGVFRYKTEMGMNRGDVALAGKIGGQLERLDSRTMVRVGRRHNSYGERSLIEIKDPWPGIMFTYRAYLDTVFAQSLQKRLCVVQREVPKKIWQLEKPSS